MSGTFEVSRTDLEKLLSGEEKFIYLGATACAAGVYLEIKKPPVVRTGIHQQGCASRTKPPCDCNQDA
jgi:hypothetical protein